MDRSNARLADADADALGRSGVRAECGDRDAPSPPPRFNFAADVLARRAARTPDATAIVAIGADGRVERWSYARVARASGRLAAALHAAGLRQGDRVLICMPRVAQWQVAMSACLHLGVIPVPCVTQCSAAELAYRARQSGARGAIAGSAFLARFAAFADSLVFRARVGPAPGGGGDHGEAGWVDCQSLIDADVPAPAFADMAADEPALMYFTSGSSGLPKAVVHAARGVFVRGWQPWRQLGVRPGDVIWTTSDTGWTRAGSCLLFGPFEHGATALIVDGTLDAADRLRILEAHEVSVFGAVASELRQIVAQAGHVPHPLPRLRWTLSAGEAMTRDLADGWQAFSGAPLVVGYGQTETPTATLTDPARPALNGMIGRPLAGNRVSVVDERGVEAAPGVEGELAFALSDPGLLLGYWVDGRIEPSPRIGEWHLTGDRGHRDADGELFFVGRADDIIGSSGYRIGPTEVENALARHPAVAECAVAASPDAMRGEIVKAFVVLREGVAGSTELERALQDHVKAEIAPYKYPRAVAFVDALPRTSSGKVSRRLLRDAEFGRSS